MLKILQEKLGLKEDLQKVKAKTFIKNIKIF